MPVQFGTHTYKVSVSCEQVSSHTVLANVARVRRHLRSRARAQGLTGAYMPKLAAPWHLSEVLAGQSAIEL